MNIPDFLQGDNAFIYKAQLAASLISVTAGPMGSLMVWRNMTFLGDTLAHASLLAVSFALLLKLPILVGLLAIAGLVALLLVLLGNNLLPNDSILSFLSYTSLALGLVLASMLPTRLDIIALLYGDILAVSWQDISLIAGLTTITLVVILLFWRRLLLVTLYPDLAKVAGLPVKIINFMYVLLIALVFSVAIKLVGVLLISALYVIPAISVRHISVSPEGMALKASLLAVFSVLSGVCLSVVLDWPTGPAIVVIMAIIFFCLRIVSNFKPLS